MRSLARYLKSFKREVFLGPLFKLTEAIFELIVPLVMARIIDVGIAQGDTGYIYRMGGVMLLLGLVGLGCALICQYFAAKASQGVGTLIRNDLFAHINGLSHAEIDQLGTASLVNRLTGDVNQVQVAVAMLIRLVVRAPFLVIGATAMAMALDLKLSLIFFAAGALVALALYLVMRRSVPLYRVIQRKLDRIGLITRENLSGVRVIRAFSKQDHEMARFERASADHTRVAIAVGKISALLNPLTFAIMNLAVVALLWFGGVQVNAGLLSQGEIIAFVNYIAQILLALVVVANLVVIFTKASASANRINEVFAATASVRQRSDQPVAPRPGAPKVSFEGVCFRYGAGGENALDHLTFAIAPGQTVGVIGATGSGKSTLVNLIDRFYDPTEGRVCIDGVDARDYPLAQLRRKIGMVPQKAVLFHGTIAQNLRWGDPEASDEALDRAVRMAQAQEMIDRMPQGMDTLVAQGAKNLSGGQKQRLTIARALVADPEILILDDSASALDFATDAALRRAIAREAAGRTVVIVSQRAHAIEHADCILVLDEGRLAGKGTHAELMATCPVYQEICRSQQRGEEAEAK
ncbi:MAG: ABC transporter ATP-binding protein [Christensenellales bacterium]